MAGQGWARWEWTGEPKTQQNTPPALGFLFRSLRGGREHKKPSKKGAGKRQPTLMAIASSSSLNISRALCPTEEMGRRVSRVGAEVLDKGVLQ